MKKIVSILFALVLVVSFALPACGPGPESGSGSGSVSGFGFGSEPGEEITLDLVTSTALDEIDTCMTSFSYLNIPSFMEDPDITVEVVPGAAIYYLGFDLYTDDYHLEGETGEPVLNMTANPLHDVALRQAIAYAIDSQAIIDTVLGEYGSLADSWVYTDDSPGHKAGLEMYEQDTTKAAQLLTDESYYKVGEKWFSPYTDEQLEFTIHTSNDLTELDTGQSIMFDLIDFGIDITLIVMDSTTYFEALYDPYKDWDMFVGSEQPAVVPIGNWVWPLITDPWGWGWGWSPTFWYHEEFNSEYEKLYTAADPDIPRGRMQEIANEELPMYMLFREHVVSAYRTNRWTNWYNELGGPVYWFNPWSIYEVEWAGDPGTHPRQLTVGTLTDVPSLNMDQESLENINTGCIYKAMVYETLAAYPKVGDDPDDPNELIPRLATNYTVTNEMRYHPIDEEMQMAQVWTVTLREGVKWHDGEDFTAEDVEYSLENGLSLWDWSKPICWEYFWETGEAVWWLNVTGTHEIEFIYEEPITTAHFPIWMCWDCIIPEHVFGPAGDGTYENWDPDPRNWDGEHIGTGPFKWEEYVHNDYHKWVRNDAWWGNTDPRFGPIDIEELYIQIFPSVVASKTETVTDDTVDAKEEADTEVEVDGTATVTVALYEENPGGSAPTGFSSLDKYIDVYVPDTTEVTELEIRLYYTDAELAAAGIDEELLGLLWWDGGDWNECSDSGVNTASINGYSGYMWAKIRNNTTPSLDDLQGTEFGGYGHPSETPGGCFIATAAYGTDTAGELDMLREFRDAVLLPNSLGAEFVSLYYKTSPPLANFISQHEILRTVVRVGFVDPIVKILTWTHNLWSA